MMRILTLACLLSVYSTSSMADTITESQHPLAEVNKILTLAFTEMRIKQTHINKNEAYTFSVGERGATTVMLAITSKGALSPYDEKGTRKIRISTAPEDVELEQRISQMFATP